MKIRTTTWKVWWNSDGCFHCFDSSSSGMFCICWFYSNQNKVFCLSIFCIKNEYLNFLRRIIPLYRNVIWDLGGGKVWKWCRWNLSKNMFNAMHDRSLAFLTYLSWKIVFKHILKAHWNFYVTAKVNIFSMSPLVIFENLKSFLLDCCLP